MRYKSFCYRASKSCAVIGYPGGQDADDAIFRAVSQKKSFPEAEVQSHAIKAFSINLP